MNDLPKLKVDVSRLSNEALFKMVNEDIANHEKAELTLAYDELERRGVLPTPTEERSLPIGPGGCLLALIVLIIDLVLTDQTFFVTKEFLSWPRAVALAALISLVAGYWERKRFSGSLWKHFVWSAGIVLIGSLALWDIPNLLRQRVSVILAFGIPGVLYGIGLFWLYEYYLPRSRQED